MMMTDATGEKCIKLFRSKAETNKTKRLSVMSTSNSKYKYHVKVYV